MVYYRDFLRRQFAVASDVIVHDVYGAAWDKGENPALARTDSAVGMTANIGIDDQTVQNDFDSVPIYKAMHEVTDTYDNVFIRVPKLYIRKTDGEGFKTWQVCGTKRPGFYLPWCYWDFVKNKELPYIDVGKHKASLGPGNKLESKPDVYPLSNTHIVNMRTYAENNNVGGLKGYQQLDIHVIDVLRTLFFIEFATLNSQAVMLGFTNGRYSADDKAVAVTINGNTVIVTNATGANYRIGQTISIHLAGATIANKPNTYGRTITDIQANVPEAGQTSIAFDGEPVNIAVDDFILNTGWKNGFSSGIAASSGVITANDGKFPGKYRGIESLSGDMFQFVDGLNINARQGWVCKDAAKYESNVFAGPDFEKLGYVNHDADGYVKEMGRDADRPFAELPTAITGSSTTTKYYCDYYYQAASQYIARFGGSWHSGSSAGFSYWVLSYSSSYAPVNSGGRLLKKPL